MEPREAQKMPTPECQFIGNRTDQIRASSFPTAQSNCLCSLVAKDGMALFLFKTSPNGVGRLIRVKGIKYVMEENLGGEPNTVYT